MVKRSLVFIALIALVVALVYLFSLDTEAGGRARISISEGMSAGDIAQILADEGVVSSKLLFVLVLKYGDLDGRIRPGQYVFNKGISATEAAAVVRRGPKRRVFKVTIPEGFTIAQIAGRLKKSTTLDADEFEKLAGEGRREFAGDFAFLNQVPQDSLEGYLFPKTFVIDDRTTARQFILILLEQFEKDVGAVDQNLLNGGRPLHEVITIASMIEKEARVPDERGLMAAVIRNRLSRGMSLQIDATIQYALPEPKERLRNKDLQVDSPYNTYQNPGLPPGPIASPGVESIRAAMDPAPVDYLYYVLTDPETGAHSFTSNYDEFLRFKREGRGAR